MDASTIGIAIAASVITAGGMYFVSDRLKDCQGGRRKALQDEEDEFATSTKSKKQRQQEKDEARRRQNATAAALVAQSSEKAAARMQAPAATASSGKKDQKKGDTAATPGNSSKKAAQTSNVDDTEGSKKATKVVSQNKMTPAQAKAEKEAAARKEAEAKAAAIAAEQAKVAKKKKQLEKQVQEAAAIAAAAEKEKEKERERLRKENEGWESVPVASSRKSNKSTSSSANDKGAPGKDDGGKAAAPKGAEATQTIEVPLAQHGKLIGPKGETMKKLQDASGARIHMPAKDSGRLEVVVEGSAEAVAGCSRAIRELVTKGYCGLLNEGFVDNHISVPSEKQGFVIGPKGVYINAIQTKTNTKINVPDKASGSNQFVIVGQKEDVKLAKSAIKQLVEEGFCSLTHDGWGRLEFDFPQSYKRYLIGAKGQTIKSIQGNNKCRINTDVDNKVVIVGPTESLVKAQKDVLRVKEKQDMPAEIAYAPGFEPSNSWADSDGEDW